MPTTRAIRQDGAYGREHYTSNSSGALRAGLRAGCYEQDFERGVARRSEQDVGRGMTVQDASTLGYIPTTTSRAVVTPTTFELSLQVGSKEKGRGAFEVPQHHR